MAAMAHLQPPEPAAKVGTLDGMERVEVEPAVRRAYLLALQLLEGLGVTVQSYASGDLDFTKTRLAGFVEEAREARIYFGEAIAANPAGFSSAFTGLLDFASDFDRPALAAGAARLEAAATLLRGDRKSTRLHSRH